MKARAEQFSSGGMSADTSSLASFCLETKGTLRRATQAGLQASSTHWMGERICHSFTHSINSPGWLLFTYLQKPDFVPRGTNLTLGHGARNPKSPLRGSLGPLEPTFPRRLLESKSSGGPRPPKEAAWVLRPGPEPSPSRTESRWQEWTVGEATPCTSIKTLTHSVEPTLEPGCENSSPGARCSL